MFNSEGELRKTPIGARKGGAIRNLGNSMERTEQRSMSQNALRVFVVAALLICFGDSGVADSCADCRRECNISERTQECLSEADEAAGFATCGALVATCMARCTCPDPERVQVCVSGATRRHDERSVACIRQFPTNATGCLDQNNQTYHNEVERCKSNP
jgi:hypothetical protein